MSVGDTCYAVIESGAAWEIGVYTYSAVNTLTRTTVLKSSNSDALIDVGLNAFVFISYIADKAVYKDSVNRTIIGAAGLVFSDASVQTTAPTAPNWGSIGGTLSSQADLSTALGLKANLASPTFTGVPSGPTATSGTNTTQLATTAFVATSVATIDLSPYLTAANAASTYVALGGSYSNPSWITSLAWGKLSGIPSAVSSLSGINTGDQDLSSYATTAAIAAGYLPLTGGTLTGDLLFTDATYDIGKLNATRPRDLFISRNIRYAGLITSTATGGGTAVLQTSGSVIIYTGFISAPNYSANGFSSWTQSSGGGFNFGSGHQIAWASTSANAPPTGVSGDLFIGRGGPGILEQRNSTNAQTFRLYNTYTSATNNEFLQLRGVASANFEIGPQNGSAGGTLRGLTIGGYSAGSSTITPWLTFDNAGAATFSSSLSTSVNISLASQITFQGDSAIRRTSAGAFEINNGTPGTYRDLVVRDSSVAGNLYLSSQAYTNTNPAIRMNHGSGSPGGIYGSNGVVGFAAASTAFFDSRNTRTAISNGAAFAWANASAQTITATTFLYSPAAGTVAQRDSTNTQCFQVYNTYTSAANFENIQIKANAGADYQIGSAVGSAGGTNRAIRFGHWNAAGTFTGTAGITSAGTYGGRFSDNGGTADSERFGADSQILGDESLAVGRYTIAGSNYSTAIGKSAYAGLFCTAIGRVAGTPGTSGGFPGAHGYSYCITIADGGNFYAPTASNQFMVAGNYTEAFFGRGVTSASQADVRFQVTGASGTNVAGSSFTIAGGKGTGTGVGGSVKIQVAPAGSSGTASNSLVDAIVIDSTSKATFANNIVLTPSKMVGNAGNYGFGVSSIGASLLPTVFYSGSGTFEFGSGIFQAIQAIGIGPTLSGYAATGADTLWYRDASGIFAQRNATTSQTLRVYNTYTSATNNEFLQLRGVASANFEIGPQNGSAGGTLRGLTIGGYLNGSSTITGWAQFRPNTTTGALEAFYLGPIADGATTGGNARGANAVDLQLARTAATQVASGAGSVAIGASCTASQSTSVAIGGSCAAAGQETVAIGSGNTASNYDSVAIGKNNAAGYGGVAIGWSNAAGNTGVGIGQGNAASGNIAVALGSGNTASGTTAFAVGNGCTASATNSVATGGSAVADRIGQRSHTGGKFAANGDAQNVLLVLRRKTTDATTATLMVDGSATRLTIPSGKIMFADILVSGIKSDGSAASCYKRKVAIKNVGGTTSLVGSVETIGTDHEDNSSTDVSITADNTNDALDISVTGIAAETWRWVAVVEGLEIAYGT